MKLPINKIKPNPSNPRQIRDDKFKKLVQSLKDFPEMADVREIVVNKDHVVLGGNMRLKAMQEAGWTEAPVKVVDWSQDKQDEFVVKDNASFGEWDWDELANQYEVAELIEWGVDLPQSLLPEAEIEEDEAPEVSSEPAISKLGEVYQLGRHRVMCGDSTSKENVSMLMAGVKADMVFTDPPYGVAIVGGSHDYNDKKNFKSGKSIENDEIDGTKLKTLLDGAFLCMAASCKKGASVYITHADTFGHIFRTSLLEAGYKIASCIIWVKSAFVFGRSDYKWQHEPILYGWLEGAGHSYYGGNNETTTWHFDRPSPTDKSQHPTIKPIGLITRAINNSSKADDIVLDLFLGSGSTLIACEQTDRTCYGMELDPKYVDVIRKRYHKFITGEVDGWELATPAII